MPLYNNVLLPCSSESKAQDSSSSVSETLSTMVAQKATPVSSSASMRFLQDHLMSKKRSKQKSNVQQKTSNKQLRAKFSDSENILPIRRFCGEPCDWDPQEEYDPMAPNSYEILHADYLKAEEQRLIAAALAKQNRSSTGGKIDTSLLNALDQLEDTSDEIKPIRGTAIAPPPALQVPSCSAPATDIGADLAAKAEKASESDQSPHQTFLTLSIAKMEGLSAAAKIMSKMGYKAGEGLGKDRQGISEPLGVEPCGPNTGRIVQTSQVQSLETVSNISPSQPKASAIISADKNKSDSHQNVTRVLLLQNMVGPGQVDEELDLETKEECSKYGEVVKCLIFEIPNKKVPDDQAVRIFVEFVTNEAALKASNDLNGRYFGGRIVRASFYDVEKFNRYELGS